VRIAASEFVENAVLAEGALSARAGAIALTISKLSVDSTAFVRNRVDGGGLETIAGAVFADELSTAALQGCQLLENSVRGAAARGGAIVSKGTLSLVNCTLGHNRVIATKDSARGGALHVLQGMAHLVGCELHHNVAESLPGSIAAIVGGVQNEGGDVVIEDSRLWGNAFGGKGSLQKDYSPSAPLHVGTAGMSTKLDRCEIFDVGEAEAEPVLDNPGSVWLAAATSLVLQGSIFRSSRAGQVLLAADPQLAQSQVLIRGCRLESVVITADGAQRPLGIVNSTFEPALGEAVPTVRPPQCAAQLAGEHMCDQRATCEAMASGGVRFSCVGAGLRYAPGLPEDGRRCEQDASLRAALESESAVVSVAKPSSLTNRTLSLIVEARGESQLNITFHVAMTRLEASSGAMIVANGSIRVDQPSMSAFGQHIEWTQLPPAPTWQAALDGSQLKFAAASRHEFTVRLACDRDEESCAADGDIITTVVQLASPQYGRVKAQEVTVQTHVVGLASCNRSVAVLMQSGGSAGSAVPVVDSPLLTSAAFVFVDLRVVDADGIPINVSLPSSVVLWGSGAGRANQLVPTKPAEGDGKSNRFTAAIEAGLRSAPGTYRLQVALSNAWNETLGAVGECVLLDQIVVVEEPQGLNTVWLSVGSPSACAVVVGAVAFWAKRKSAELRHVLVLVLTETLKTVLSLGFKLGNLATDLLTTYRVVFEGIGKSPRYLVPYAVFGCASIIAGLVAIAQLVRRASEMRSQIKANAEIQRAPRAAVGPAAAARHAVVHKLQWERQKVSRDLKGQAVGVLVFLLEDLPMVRSHDWPPVQMCSVCGSHTEPA
jgi:hypothetical protein